ncbi:MAG: hypothetical protein ACOC44_08285 [Promethearchaeia archaeon]
MPKDAQDEKKKTIDDYLGSVESSRYYHDLYLKAVNHPIRRAILDYINQEGSVSKDKLICYLKQKGLLNKESDLGYHLDFLQKSLCIEKIKPKGETPEEYRLQQAGEVIKFLK